MVDMEGSYNSQVNRRETERGKNVITGGEAAAADP
mgnify:CR=1 FL=1|jgi:hypothetical protein